MIDIVVPQEQEGTKAVVRNWLKKIGDQVATDDPVVELETDKVTQEVCAPASGILREILLASGADAMPGSVLARVEPKDSYVPAAKAAGQKPVAATVAPPDIKLSPAVRFAVRQHNLDPAKIPGTGRDGRITRADVDKFLEKPKAAPATPSVPGGVKVIPHDRMRLAIAENMSHSVTVAPHVTAVFEADLSAIMAHRKKHKPIFEKEGVNLTYTAYFVAASAAAMAAAPAVNSRWHDDRLEIFDDINIGVGTALGDQGLVVPVIQRTQDLSLKGIAARLGDLTERARRKSLSPADMRGGTFTISNHGVSGSLFASPIIIMQPQSAILGIGKVEKRIVVREVDGVDTIQIRPMAYVSLTIDHRVLDGHQTNGWLTKFVATLESWV